MSASLHAYRSSLEAKLNVFSRRCGILPVKRYLPVWQDCSPAGGWLLPQELYLASCCSLWGIIYSSLGTATQVPQGFFTCDCSTALGLSQWALTSGHHSKVDTFGWVYTVFVSSMLLL